LTFSTKSSIYENESSTYITSTSNTDSSNYINKINVESKNSPLDSMNSNIIPSYTNSCSLNNNGSASSDNLNYKSSPPLNKSSINYTNSIYIRFN